MCGRLVVRNQSGDACVTMASRNVTTAEVWGTFHEKV